MDLVKNELSVPHGSIPDMDRPINKIYIKDNLFK